MENYFAELNAVDVNDKVEKKNGLTYLSWAFAWGELKKRHPNANYKVYETDTGMNYFNDGRTGWVKTGVTVEGIEHIEYLPIMDYKNKSIPVDSITSFDVNKAIQRSLTKAVARHGLGLYIYAGEDLPEGCDDAVEPVTVEQVKEVFQAKKYNSATELEVAINNCRELEELDAVYQKNRTAICATPKLLDLVTERGRRLKGAA